MDGREEEKGNGERKEKAISPIVKLSLFLAEKAVASPPLPSFQVSNGR